MQTLYIVCVILSTVLLCVFSKEVVRRLCDLSDAKVSNLAKILVGTVVAVWICSTAFVVLTDKVVL